MTDNTPNEPIEPITDATTIQPVPEVPAPMASDAMAQPLPTQPLPTQHDFVAEAQYSSDPQPLAVNDNTSQNWMGLVALLTGIFALPIFAIIFGILGLSAVRKGKATNKGMSITGIVLGGVWIVIGAVVAGILLFLVADATSTSIDSAQVGDCYVSTVVANETEELEDVNPVFGSCETDSNAEVYFIGDYTGSVATTDPAFTDELWAFCTNPEAIAKLDADIASEYYIEYYVANTDDWDGGNHTIVCGLSNPSGALDPAAITE